MKVKRFTAPTMAEALRQVKATLGPEAVILETTEAAGQVTVTAAVDLDAPAGGATDPAAGGATDPADGALVSEVRELMSVVRQLVDEQWRRQVPPGGRGIRRLHRAVVAQGGDGVIAEVRRAKDPVELGNALRDHGRADLVLIDTAGAGPAQQTELAELKALADAAGAEAGRTLVVSAATGALAAANTWRAFAALAPDACVLTKADTAPGGPIVAQLWRERVPVSHVAAGRRIPDDLEAATPKHLVRCLLAA